MNPISTTDLDYLRRNLQQQFDEEMSIHEQSIQNEKQYMEEVEQQQPMEVPPEIQLSVERNIDMTLSIEDRIKRLEQWELELFQWDKELTYREEQLMKREQEMKKECK